jgi:hypothetical protein
MLIAALPTFAAAQRASKTAPLAAALGVTAKSAAGGVQISWQAVPGATQYVIVRSPNATTTGAAVGTVAAPTLTFLDRGVTTAAYYQVGAVAADGRKSASVAVAYQPAVAGATVGQTVGGKAPTTLTNAPPPVATLSIASIANAHPVFGGYPTAHLGDTLIVAGNGFLGVTSVALLRDPSGPQLVSVTTFAGTIYGFKFVIPATLPLSPVAPGVWSYRLIVSRPMMADTSKGAISIGYPVPVRKITSVKMAAVLSNKGRIRITGIGFADKTGPAGYPGITDAYFGTGQMGSMTNQSVPLGNLTDTYVELWLPSTCDQEGILMLTAPKTGGTPDIILPDGVIRAACLKDPPSGLIAGSEGTLDGHVNVKAGSTITIRGKGLKYVTRVRDSGGHTCPSTYASGGPAGDVLTVTIPMGTTPTNAPCGGTLYFENNLTDPDYQSIVTSTATGTINIMLPPTLQSTNPLWAEAGGTVTVSGYNFSYGQPPKVTVGGVPAVVTDLQPMSSVSFKLGAGTTTGPIAITNEAGTATISGPVKLSGGVMHPGFFVVSGPSVIQSISVVVGATYLEYSVKGQNMARLGGICVKATNMPSNGFTGQMLPMKRYQPNSGSWPFALNDEMIVTSNWRDYGVLKGGEVQLYVQNDAPGQWAWMSSSFSCAPNSSTMTWP